jgi:hypothetical protein
VGEVEEERGKTVRRVAAGATLLGIDGDARSRTRETPFVTRRSRTGAWRHREHRSRAANHVNPATTTPPPRCEHHGHPSSLRRYLTLSLSVGAPSSRHLLSASRRCFPMNGAVSRLAGESLEPWLPQAASTGRTR